MFRWAVGFEPSTRTRSPAIRKVVQHWLQGRLAELEAAGLLRDPADARVRAELERRFGDALIDATSNDYLGFAAGRVSRETTDSAEPGRLGAGASRLVQGTFPDHEALEAELAGWTGFPASLLATSAFVTNLGTIPALGEPGALIVSDALNHASIVDGCRLARARVVVTPHLELGAIEAALRSRSGTGAAWVVMEALFSMDGDSPDLPALRALCDRYGAGLLLDEAHSLGVFGPEGAGLAAQEGVRADALVGGLGKAVGAQGGFIAGSDELRTWLWNRARPAIFSTAPSPLLCRLVLTRLREVRRADAARVRLLARSAELRAALAARGVKTPSGRGPIVPVLLGDNQRALHVMQKLREQGILVQAIRPPTVPAGAARLRLTVGADWPDGAVLRLAAAVEAACGS